MSDRTNMLDYLVFVGRFQPFHQGHLAVLQQALTKAKTVILVVGSARKFRNIKNPFTDSERQEMIAASLRNLGEDVFNRVKFCTVKDYYDDTKWCKAIHRVVQELVVDVKAEIGIIGHHKDASSYYLQKFPQWETVLVENFEGLNSTDIRQLMFAGGDETKNWFYLKSSVPSAVYNYLQEAKSKAYFSDLLTEYQFIERYKERWSKAPYPPIFVTVDAVVFCQQHVLMVKRLGQPSKGAWALPGGFVDQRERLVNAALRELREETVISVSDEDLHSYIKDKEVFDHPDRSLRGRTITHAYYFDLPLNQLPVVKGTDDAEEAKWIPISALKSMEMMIFEDHFEILNRFLQIDE